MTALCAKCGGDSQVIDSRPNAKHIRRRRRCKSCDYRWTTLEVPEGTLILEASTKRFAQFHKEINELIERFMHEEQT